MLHTTARLGKKRRLEPLSESNSSNTRHQATAMMKRAPSGESAHHDHSS
jgi:hypothetical protein